MKEKYVLDGHKALYHTDRIKKWLNGKHVAPISIDWAITRNCPYRCRYCYSQFQENPGRITRKAAMDFLTDCAEIGVLATTLTGDGENTISPFYYDLVTHGKDVGLDMATATCGYPLKEDRLPKLLSQLTYLRFTIAGAEPHRYSYIHGVPESYFHKVYRIIDKCVKLKNENEYNVTIGLQMVLMPDFGDQILPLTKLGKELGVDYLVIKHCSDDELGSLGIKYSKYRELYPLLKEAESYTDENYLVKVKWSKILAGKTRKYIQCFAAPFLIQVSGSGLVAPCGFLFNPKYKKYHIGNIVETRFKDLFHSDRYWKVIDLLSSDNFDARKNCGYLCLQHYMNNFLWDLKQGKIDLNDLKKPIGEEPMHINFL